MLASSHPEITPLEAATDEQLVAVYQQSADGAAVAELVRRHLGNVRQVVFHMVSDDSVADDLTQEAMLRALRGLSGFRGNSTVKTWLHRVALNVTYDYLKRMQRSPVEYWNELPDAPTTNANSRESMEFAELDADVEAALAKLSPKLRAAIVLTVFEKLGVKQAARVEGCSTATMYWRIHEARRRLRLRLKPWLT